MHMRNRPSCSSSCELMFAARALRRTSAGPWTMAKSRAAAPPRASLSGAATTTLWLPRPAIRSPARPSTSAMAAMRSVSSSTWFAGGNVGDGGRAAPCRATIRRASQGATAPIRKRFPNEQITRAGTKSADVPFGGSQTTISASSTVTARNSGQRHAPSRRQRIRRAQKPPAVLTPPAYFRPAPPNGRLREYHLSHTDVRHAAIPYGALTTNRSGGRSRRAEEGEEMATTTARPAALVHPKPNEAGASDARAAALSREDRTSLLRHMLLMRATEERALTLYRQGKVPGSYYDGRGQEAVSVGSAYALGPRDRACILHRDLGAHLIRGVSPGRVLAQMMGRATGVTGGRDGNMHFGDRRLGCVGMVSMLPDMALVACGLGIAFQMRREPRVAMTWFGEGSTANGVWHEAMNVAGLRRLPVVFVLENNQFAYSTPNDREFAVDPVARAEGYGFPGLKVDGNDVEAVFAAAAEACERARRGGGPTLIEAETMRMHGHGAHDDMRYVPKELFEHWAERDPIDNYGRTLAREGVDVGAIHASVREELERETEWALAQPMPDPATAADGVFADDLTPLGDGKAPWSRWEAANA